jgi:hypothetical protein
MKIHITAHTSLGLPPGQPSKPSSIESWADLWVVGFTFFYADGNGASRAFLNAI